MKVLDATIQSAVDSHVRTDTIYRVLVDVVTASSTYYWADATVVFGGQEYDGRLVEVGQINGLLIDGMRNSAAKRTFSFTVADTDGHALSSLPVGFFHGAKVTVREIFDGIAAEGRHHSFQVDRVSTVGRTKLTFECASQSPLVSETKVGVLIKAEDFAVVDEGVIGMSVPTIFGSKKLALPVISTADARFLIGYGDYEIVTLWQNGTELNATSGPFGFHGFHVEKVGQISTVVFNNPSEARNVLQSGDSLLPITALVTRLGSWSGGPGQVGNALLPNNPVNVFTDYWVSGGGDISVLNVESFNAAGASFETDGVVFNGAVNGSVPVSSALRNLLLSCGGRVVESDQVYFYRFSEPPTGAVSFDESNILRVRDGDGTTFSRTDVDLSTLHNKSTVSFEKWDALASDQNAAGSDPNEWQATYEDATSVALIGVQERTESSWFIGDWEVADRAAQILVRQELAGLREYTFETTLQAMAVDEGDSVTVSWPSFGLNAKPCLVTRATRLSGRRIQLTVRELASVFWENPGQAPNPAYSTDPAKAIPATPTWGVPAVGQVTRVEADGTVLQDVTFDWMEVTHPLLRGYEVWVGIDVSVAVDGDVLPSNPSQLLTITLGSQYVFYGAQVGKTYYVRVRAITGNGLVSALSVETSHLVTAKPSIYEGVSGVSATYQQAGIDFAWNLPSAEFTDFARFEVGVPDGFSGWTIIKSTTSNRWTAPYLLLKNSLAAIGFSVRSGLIVVRAVDRSGNKSGWVTITFENPVPAKITGLTAGVGFTAIFLDSAASPIPDDVVRREWEWAPEASGSPDVANAKAFSATRRTSAVFSGQDGTLYWFRCRDIDWLGDVLGDQDSSPWSDWISQATEAIADAGLAFDALANVTTKNLVRNSGFERWSLTTNPDMWILVGSGTASKVTGGASGSFSARVSSPAADTGIQYTFAADALQRCKGHVVTASFKHKHGSSAQARLSLVEYGATSSGSGDLGLVSPSASWTRSYFSWSISTSAIAIGVRLHGDPSGAGGYTYFDEVMLQIGDKVTAYEPHDLDFLSEEGGITETEIANDAITTPKLKANSVVAKHILAGQIGAKQIFVAADRVVSGSLVYRCILTHGPGAPAPYNQSNYQPGVTSGWGTYWSLEGSADPSLYSTWVFGTAYFGGTVVADQIAAQGAILGNAHIGSLGVDHLTTGTLASALTITGADGSTWDSTGLHLSALSSIEFGSIKARPAGAIFSETWDGSALSHWVNYGGAGELQIISTSESISGGNILRFGNTSSNYGWVAIHTTNIPFDPNALYRIKARIRRLQSNGTVCVGWAGIGYGGVDFVNVSGANTASSQHYHGVSFGNPNAAWTEYVGFTMGFGATNGTGNVGTITSPGKMHPNVRYIRPMIIANYNSVAGIMDVDSIIVDVIPSQSQLDLPASATQPYITATGITSTSVSSPTIIGNTGRFSEMFYVGTSAAGIKLDGTNGNIQSNDFVAGSTGWQIKHIGGVEFNYGTFRGTVDITGTSGGVSGETIITGGTIKNYSDSTLIFEIDPYPAVSSGATLASVRMYDPGLSYRHALGADNFSVPALFDSLNSQHVWISPGYVYSWNKSNSGKAINGRSSGAYGTAGYFEADSSTSVGVHAISLTTGAIPLAMDKSSGDTPHFRFNGTFRTANPNTTVTGKAGDVMAWWYGSGNRMVLAMCYGNGSGPNSTGTIWHDFN